MIILIKGMEMPSDGMIGVFISSDGNVYDSMDDIIGTIVPVPPQGRLIDADALKKTIRPITEEDDFGACTFRTVKALMKKHIDDAPTIIEAEVDDG